MRLLLSNKKGVNKIQLFALLGALVVVGIVVKVAIHASTSPISAWVDTETQTTAHAGWSAGTPPNGAVVTGYTLSYATHAPVNLPATTHSYTLTGLSCGSRHSAVVVMNYKGGYILSNYSNFTTAACAKPAASVAAATCTITAPSSVTGGTTIKPVITVTNIGSKSFSANVSGSQGYGNGIGNGEGGGFSGNWGTVAAGKSISQTFTINLLKANDSTRIIGLQASGTNPSFNCDWTADILTSAGVAPTSLPVATATPVPVVSSASCTISGYGTSIAGGSKITPTFTITNTGNVSMTPHLTINYGLSDGKGHGEGGSSSETWNAIAPGQSVSKTEDAQTVQHKSADVVDVSYQIQGTSPSFTCSKTATIY